MAANTSGEQDGFNSMSEQRVLTINDTTITIGYHKHTGLPMLPIISVLTAPYGLLTMTTPTNFDLTIHGNLSPSQRVKLILHDHFNHINMKCLNS
jgi:hypothetical protein